MVEQNDEIAAIRAFNRFYTRIMGLLEEGLHQTAFSLTDARVIHEIGKQGRVTGSELSRDLGIDRGQLSRQLWRLADAGVLAMTPGIDRRSSGIALTREGDAIYSGLNALSDAAAERVLSPLDVFRRTDLVAAMKRIQTVLAGPVQGQALVLRPHRIGEIGWLIHRQGLLYHLEQGWNGEFETLIARIYADFEAAPVAPPKTLWIAEHGGELAGSVFVIPADAEEGSAQLRMLYVEPAFRGLGIGKRLVGEAVTFARQSGYRQIMLWTQDSLVSARKIYQSAGFQLLREEAHHSFGADLNGQYWVLKL